MQWPARLCGIGRAGLCHLQMRIPQTHHRNYRALQASMTAAQGISRCVLCPKLSLAGQPVTSTLLPFIWLEISWGFGGKAPKGSGVSGGKAPSGAVGV